MTFLAVMTIVLLSALTVKMEVTVCPNDQAKELLEKHKVTTDVTSLLQGKTFVDVWRRQEIADTIDCAMTQYKLEDHHLRVSVHNVEKDGNPVIFNEMWSEIKGQGQFVCTGDFEEKGEIVKYNGHFYTFYADEYVFGYFTCGLDNEYMIMAISIAKDKKEDPKALESLVKAEAVMAKVKSIMPEEMKKMSQAQCPDKV